MQPFYVAKERTSERLISSGMMCYMAFLGSKDIHF